MNFILVASAGPSRRAIQVAIYKNTVDDAKAEAIQIAVDLSSIYSSFNLVSGVGEHFVCGTIVVEKPAPTARVRELGR